VYEGVLTLLTRNASLTVTPKELKAVLLVVPPPAAG